MFLAPYILSALLAVAAIALGAAAWREAAKIRAKERNNALLSGKEAPLETPFWPFVALENRLLRAGLEVPPGIYAAAVAFLSLAIGAAALAGNPWYIALAAALVPLALSEAFIRFRTASRKGDFEEQFREALPMMADAMRSGMTLEQSFSNVSNVMSNPISAELKRLASSRVYGGLSLAEAIRAMAERTGSRDAADLACAVAVQNRTGGALSDVIDSQVQAMRQREGIRLHKKAVTANARISTAMLVGEPLVLIVVFSLISPGYMSFFVTNPAGVAMVGLSLAFEVVGLLLIRRVYKLDID